MCESKKIYLLNIIKNNPKRFTQIIKKDKELYTEIQMYSSGATFSQKLYNFIYNMTTPKCKNCGVNEVEFLRFKDGYRDFCSTKCMSHSTETKLKRKKSIVDVYGVEHYSKTNAYKTKYKATSLNKYGVDNPSKCKAIKQKKSDKKKKSFLTNYLILYPQYLPLFKSEDYLGVREKHKWLCKVCGLSFHQDLFQKELSCPDCFPKKKFISVSSYENEIYEVLLEHFSDECILRNNRKIISPKELDIYITSKNVAIEFCGLYYHSDLFLDKNYHLNKLKMCEEKSIRLITIFQDEWLNYKSQCIDKIKKCLDIKTNDIIYGRNTKVVHIDNYACKKFLDANHFQGYSKSTINLGLTYNDKLVSVMTFSRPRFQKDKKETYEIIRYASENTVIGGGSKLLKHFIKNYEPKVIYTYCDRRWSDGSFYEKLGFNKVSATKPNYWYVHKNMTGGRINRLNFTKKSLLKEGHSAALTENEIMKNKGYIRIYDCGSYLYKMEL